MLFLCFLRNWEKHLAIYVDRCNLKIVFLYGKVREGNCTPNTITDNSPVTSIFDVLGGKKNGSI